MDSTPVPTGNAANDCQRLARLHEAAQHVHDVLEDILDASSIGGTVKMDATQLDALLTHLARALEHDGVHHR